MDIQQLRYFSMLATTQNFTRASAELHLTQSALSKSISAIEAELGTELFDRTSRGAHLNDAGREFYRFATAVLTEYDRCLQRIQSMADTNQHTVNLICNLPEIFVRVLERFHQEYPDVSVRLPTSNTMSSEELLLTHQLDFVLTSMPVHHTLIEWVPVMRDEFFLSVPDSMPFEPWAEVDLWELREEPFIMPQRLSENRPLMEGFCSQAGFTPHIAFEVTEAEASRKLVELGYGIAMVSSLSMFNTKQISGRPRGELQMKFLRIRRPYCYRPIGFCRLKNQPLSSSASNLYDCFFDYLTEMAQQISSQFPRLITGGPE